MVNDTRVLIKKISIFQVKNHDTPSACDKVHFINPNCVKSNSDLIKSLVKTKLRVNTLQSYNIFGATDITCQL